MTGMENIEQDGERKWGGIGKTGHRMGTPLGDDRQQWSTLVTGRTMQVEKTQNEGGDSWNAGENYVLCS